MPIRGTRAEYNHCNNNMLADNNYNASALFWYTQRYHTETRSEDRVPLALGARSDWGLLGVFRSFDGVNRPWGSPAYLGVRRGPRAFSLGVVEGMGGGGQIHDAFCVNNHC